MSNSVLPQEGSQQQVTSQTRVVQKDSAGGLDPDRFDWQEVWYPVCYTEDLNKSGPTRFTLLATQYN
ncbi:Phenylpropionate dioxygenase or related ring-hydroxylating dioxygenase, large terminal subunit (plasmid) [Nostoc flagelliforme CCNUN1]|uniref:Phenylpropionate dioxygenase or related ring-hydroxylating dioxygenase, large terminal subunit n=1 Tax=Nostoc flagelliforme CCNUN1 TaxID=2038116 RepID=A0A2K8TAK7_9NOSO|nr:Phenylpropionate dioxygenase or related ring-hydroxylating dioxygenase, large terminal subunit [Nostoc flagelliforme CCNUN1]